MRSPLTCTQGHRWDPISATDAFCPFCGSPAVVPHAKRPNPHVTAKAATPPPLPHSHRPSPHSSPRASLIAATIAQPPHAAPAVQPAPTAATAHPSPPAAIAPPSTDINWTKVDVAPSLPMPVFTSTERWQSQRVGALAIYCSDGRWGDAFDEFCHRALLIPHYDRFAVPGGPAWITRIDSDQPDLYRAAHGQLEYLVRAHELDTIVLITHYGCGFYREHLKQDDQHCLPRQIEDVKTAAASLREWFKDIRVEGYLAMQTENVMSFHALKI